MDPISPKTRHFLAFVVVAGITAAVLRHFFHVNVGFSREEIRMGAFDSNDRRNFSCGRFIPRKCRPRMAMTSAPEPQPPLNRDLA